MKYNLQRKKITQTLHYGVMLAMTRGIKLNTLKYEVKVKFTYRDDTKDVF